MGATLDPVLRRGVGASQIAMLFGLSPFGGPLKLYQQIVAPAEDAANAVQRRGTRGERFLAEEYADRHGLLQVDGAKPAGPSWDAALWCPPTQRHVAHDFLIASPDRIEFRAGKPVRVVEVKTSKSTRGWRDPEEVPDGAPMHYLLQVAQQMMVGLDGEPIERGALVASVGHMDDYREYHVDRNASIEHAIVEKAGAFWHDHVLPRRPPDWDGSEAGDDLLRKLYPHGGRPELRPATKLVQETMAKLKHARIAFDSAESEKRRLEQVLKDAIGSAGNGFKSDAFCVTWSQNKSSIKTDWRAVAQALAPSDELILLHTNITPGATVLRPTWRDDE